MLNMKDNDCLDVSRIQSAVLEMMDELEKNRRKNINPLMNSLDSDDDSFVVSTSSST